MDVPSIGGYPIEIIHVASCAWLFADLGFLITGRMSILNYIFHGNYGIAYLHMPNMY